jgi:hypothetical protein
LILMIGGQRDECITAARADVAARAIGKAVPDLAGDPGPSVANRARRRTATARLSAVGAVVGCGANCSTSAEVSTASGREDRMVATGATGWPDRAVLKVAPYHASLHAAGTASRRGICRWGDDG